MDRDCDQGLRTGLRAYSIIWHAGLLCRGAGKVMKPSLCLRSIAIEANRAAIDLLIGGTGFRPPSRDHAADRKM